MASSEGGTNRTFVADGAVTANHFAQATNTGNRTAAIASDATSVVGVIAMDALDTEDFPMETEAGVIVPIELAATLAAGAAVMSNGAGEAVALSGVDAVQGGILLQGGDDGDIVEMLLQPMRGVSA